MRRKFLLMTFLTLLLTAMGTGALYAQDNVVTIGSITNVLSGDVPLCNNYEYSISQQYYLSGEIGESKNGNTITHVAFYADEEDKFHYARSLTIYMVNTEESYFVYEKDNNYTKKLDASNEVFTGNVSFKEGDWNRIELNTPFKYTGKNILLCVVDNTNDWEGYSGDNTYGHDKFECFNYKGDGTYRSISTKNSDNKYDPTASEIEGRLSEQVPCVQFTFEVPIQFEGEGTATSPYIIANIDDLNNLRNKVNEGETYVGKYFELTSDITLTEAWTPIGTGSRSSKSYSGNAFKGTFDGGNNTISGLTITSTSGADAAVGLFGIVDGGTVKNLNLTNVNINVASSNLAGAAIGMMLNGATADNITVSGAIVGNDGVGGIVGRLIINGTISNCTNNASVTSSYGGIGGIVGKPYYEDGANTSTFASITNCTNNGTVTAPMYIGGIAGLARANVIGCTNNGAVVGGTQTGGIVGQLIAAGTVSGNENKAKVSGKNHLGGIIGDYSQSSAYTYYNVSIANNINRGELEATEQCAAIMGCNNIDGFDAMTATGNLSYYYVEGLELFGNPEDMVIDATNKFILPEAKIDDVEYSTLAEAAAAAQAGDEIILLADATVEGTLALPAGIKLTSNGHTINGSIRMLGDLELNGPLTITGGLWVGKTEGTLTATLSGDKLTASYFMFQRGTYTINADIDAVYGYLSYEGTFEVNSTIHTTGANGEVLYINGNVTLNDGAVLDSDNSVWVCNDNAVLTLKSGSKVDSNVKITKSGAKLNIDATGMTAGASANITGTVTNSGNGTIAVVGNDNLEASIVDGKVVLAAKPVAKIGETPYTTLEAAFAAATEGQTITMLVDATPALTSQRAITKASVIDLGGKTLTLTEDDLYFGTTTFQNGNIVVDPSVKPSTAVFWMFANQTLTFDNVKIVATGVTGTYLIGLDGNNSDLNLLNGSEIVVENTTALDLDIICVNASTGNDIKVENSKVNVTNLDGRVFFRGNYTVKDSEVNLAGITKAGFRIEAGQTLSIEGTSQVNIEGEPRDGGIHMTDATAKYTKEETATVNATVNRPAVAKIGDTPYYTFAEAAAAAQAGSEIKLLANIGGDITVPANVTLNGNGFAISGGIFAEGDITFAGVTTAADFDANVVNTAVNIPAGASLQLKGPARLVIGHGATFNITGTIEDAKTADKATLVPSLKIAAGASITGNGVTFNVNNAYIVANANTTSKNSNANGTLDFNINNSIWEQTGVLAFYVPTSGMDPVVNFELKNSVLTTTSHLVFSVTKGEIVIDNSLVNQGTARQIENRSTMTIKNSSVVNGAVATSSNAINPGTIIVENATYAVTGEFSGAAEGTGKLIIKKGANVSVGSITAGANVVVDAEGMAAGDKINFTANLSHFTGTLSVINNDNLEAKIVDDKIELAAKPVAQIGDVEYATLQKAIDACEGENNVITLLSDLTFESDLSDAAKGYFNIADGKKVVLDMNGKTINVTDNSTGNFIVFYNYGEFTVANGMINLTSTNDRDWNAESAIFLNRGGIFNIENGTYTHNGGTDMAFVVDNSGNYYGDATTNIYERTLQRNTVTTELTSSYIAIRNRMEQNSHGASGETILNVYGGTISGTSRAIWAQASSTSETAPATGKINVEGGNIGLIDTPRSTGAVSMTTISGGEVSAFKGEAGELTVTGGTLNEVTLLTAAGETVNDYAVNKDGLYVQAVAKVDETNYADLQEAIKAAAPAGTVEILADVVVDEWIMFSETLNISSGQIITMNIDGLTINGNGKTVTIKSIESASNGGYLFYDAQNLTVKDLTINIADGLVGGIGLQSGTISNVTFNGGQYAVLPGANGVTIDGCTFNGTTGYAVYYEDARPGIVVNNNTFNTADGAYAITMRSNEQFTNNNITKGRVNLANSAVSTVSGNDFGTERFKVYNGATATISDNVINNLVFNETNAPAASTFAADNTLSPEAQAAINALPVLAGEGTEANPYTIGNLAQLKAFRDDVNAGNNYAGKYVKLAADIDLNNEEWTPIGNDTYKFQGYFDGNEKTISNLKVTGNTSHKGFFGYINGTGMSATTTPSVKDLTLDGVNVNVEGNYVGGLAGQAYTCNITNVTVKGNVSGVRYVGGLVGHVYTYFKNCHFIGNASCSFDALGGIAGAGDCRAYDCSVIGDITGSNWVGGIVGNGQEGTSAVGCYVKGDVKTSTNWYFGVGGIAGVAGHGYSSSEFKNNYFDGEVYLEGEKVPAMIIGIVNAENNETINATIEGNSWNTTHYDVNIPVYVTAEAPQNGTKENWIAGASEELTKPRNNNLVMLESDIQYVEATDINDVTIMKFSKVTEDEILPQIVENNQVAYIDSNADGAYTEGETKYTSLQDALNAGGNVTVLRDIALAEGVTVAADKTVVLDLNGKVISRNTEAATSTAAITNNGNLTIKDSSNPSTGKITAFAANPDTQAVPYYASNTITNCGVLTVLGGTIENSTGDEARAAFPIDNNSTSRDAIVTIEGGKVTGRGAIRQFANSTTHKNEVNVKDGEVFGSSYAIWVQNPGSGDPKAALNIIEDGKLSKILISPSANFDIAISGGELTEVAIWSADETNPERNPSNFISGGTFSNEVPAEFLAPGCVLEQNGNGTYGVVVDPAYGKVAKVGDVYYADLHEAYNAAQAEQTITLLDSITLGEKFVIEKSITLDGNGKKLTYTGTDRAIDVPNNADANIDVTIKNLNVVATTANRGLNYNENGKFNVEDVTVTIGENVDGYAINFPGMADNAQVTIKNSELTSRNPLNIWGENMVINVYDSEIISVDNSTTYDYAAIQLNNDNYGNVANGTVVNVYGGRITALNDNYEPSNVVANATETGVVNISDETIVTGKVLNYVANIGGVYFGSLQAAVNAIEKYGYNSPIVIMKSFATSETATVKNGLNVTIDLNGKTITGTDTTSVNFSIIDNRGTLTITDNTQSKEGKITLTATIDSDWNRYSAVIANNPGGKLTIEAGTLEHLGGTDMAYGIDNLTNGKGTYAETVINGGYIKSTYRGIRQFLNGVEAQNILTVNGGTIEGANKSIWMQDPSAKANTGTLTVGEEANLIGDVYLYVTPNSTEWPVEVSIAAEALAEGSEVMTANLPVGVDVQKINGTYGVVNVVAQIGDVKYQTLQEAVDASTVGDTVTVINNVELDSIVTIAADKVVTLDLNGDTINTAWEDESAEKHYYAFDNKGTLTITDNSTEANGVINARGNFNYGTLTLEKGTINAIDHNGGYGVRNYEGSKFTMKGGLIATTYENGDDPGDGYDATTVRVDSDAEFIMNGGNINNISNFTIAIENYGTTTINENAGEVKSVHTTVANHGTMTINGGSYTCNGLEGITAHAIWATDGSTTTINGGTFNGKDNYNGFNVDASAGAVVEINGGNFEPVHSGSLYGEGTITVKGGTFFDNVSERCADGYAALPDLNGNYIVGVKPTATVNNLGMTTVAAGDYMVYGSGTNTEDMPLSFVMQFLADQDAEDMATSPFAEWYSDFVITFTGIENGSFTADGCYLAGHYGSFGWVKVPVDGMTIEDGVHYPVMLGVGMGQKYDYICSGVEDFKCALYLTPEILAANPNIQVNLELAIVDNSQGSDAATNALVNNDKVYGVTDYTYDAEDFMLPVAKIGDVTYTSLQEAVDAVAEGETIVLIDNIEQADGVIITDKKNIIIDLNEKTFTVTEGANTNNRNFKINGTSVVTIKNGTMIAAGEYSSGAYGTVRTEGSANVTLTGLKLYNYRGNGLNIKALYGTTVEIDSTEIYSQYGGGIEAAGGTITLAETVKVEQKGMYTAPFNSMAISVNGGGTVTVAGGTYSTECITAEEANNQGTSHGPWVVGVLNSGGTLIINGGTFSNDNFGDNSLATYARGAVLADTKANVQINGGTFNALAKIIDIQNNLGDAANNPVVTLKGGTYSANPTNDNISDCIVLAQGYELKQLDNGYFTVIQFATTLTRELAAGWSWFSSYVDTDLDGLKASLEGNGTREVRGKVGNRIMHTKYNGASWGGTLNTFFPEQMYMIESSQVHTMEYYGEFIEDAEIVLYKGWNWIAYPLHTEMTLKDALANFTPADGDVIKNKEGNESIYYSLYSKWYPEMTLVPGEGYMYYSNNTVASSFVYSTVVTTPASRSSVANVEKHWSVDTHKYPFNMTMTAVFEDAMINNYEIAAFVNGECRGSARPTYIAELDTYLLFLAIHGEKVENVTFTLYDIDTDTEYELSNSINYTNDAIFGSIDNPYVFSRGTTGIGETAMSNVNIYPNPTTTGTEINLEATCDKVEVFNALGVKVIEYHNVDSIDALETAGIYVIRITNNGNVQNCRLVVK